MAGNWSVIHAERRSLARDLDGIESSQWSKQSLCAEWSIQQLLGHMIATARTSPGVFLANMVRNGFSLQKMTMRNAERESAGSSADTLARFKDVITSTKSPPAPAATWLGEILVHSEDIRRPLGIAHDYPKDALATVASFYARSNAIIGGRKRVEGLSLRATDHDWTSGTGPEVSGPIMSIVLAMTGRQAALDDLQGDGVAQLRTRP